jgi:hypothetical protein
MGGKDDLRLMMDTEGLPSYLRAIEDRARRRRLWSSGLWAANGLCLLISGGILGWYWARQGVVIFYVMDDFMIASGTLGLWVNLRAIRNA